MWESSLQAAAHGADHGENVRSRNDDSSPSLAGECLYANGRRANQKTRLLEEAGFSERRCQVVCHSAGFSSLAGGTKAAIRRNASWTSSSISSTLVPPGTSM